MNVVEIEEYIKPLTHAEKLQLIQDIAEMLKERDDEALLHRLSKAAEAPVPLCSGPLEAYETAVQLHSLIQEAAI